jgi:DNA-binding NarL/FixJ family response regulator
MKQKLSFREVEIIKYSADGRTAKEIARLIGLEHRTVETYMTSIRKKLAARNIANVIYIACKYNVINQGYDSSVSTIL